MRKMKADSLPALVRMVAGLGLPTASAGRPSPFLRLAVFPFLIIQPFSQDPVRSARSLRSARLSRCTMYTLIDGAGHMACASGGRLLGRPPLLARDDVGGVPLRPVVLRSSPFVLAMVSLSLAGALSAGDVQVAESSPGKTRLDLLEQTAVAVRITE